VGIPVLTLNVGDNRPLDNWSMTQAAVLVVTTNPNYVSARRLSAAYLATNGPEHGPVGFGAVLVPDSVACPEAPPVNTLKISAKLDYLRDGDVIRISPEGRVSVLFRHNATFNAFLLTERCNSFCVMCSQPPRDLDDAYRVDDLLRAIPMIDGAREICLSGGEPTLLGDRFFVLVNALKAYLPNTSVHVLSNGRLFKSLDLAYRLAGCRHPDLMVGVPLYSDISSIHDFVVQADGAYDETIQGILNLKRCSVRVELRVVIHKHTYERLPQLARFISRNLQFVDQVALMGLEATGFAKTNFDDLWVEPVDYSSQLMEAVTEFNRSAVRVKVYNHQLCTLHPSVRPFAVQSISDWKREYLDVCSQCDVRGQCGGLFGTSGDRHSAFIEPIRLQGVTATMSA